MQLCAKRDVSTVVHIVTIGADLVSHSADIYASL